MFCVALLKSPFFSSFSVHGSKNDTFMHTRKKEEKHFPSWKPYFQPRGPTRNIETQHGFERTANTTRNSLREWLLKSLTAQSVLQPIWNADKITYEIQLLHFCPSLCQREGHLMVLALANFSTRQFDQQFWMCISWTADLWTKSFPSLSCFLSQAEATVPPS